ncbi:MAG TPA: hypothetical protein VIJ36_20920 [Thermoanaerobaculia bacterium]
MIPTPDLTPDQEAQAEQLAERILQASRDDIRGLARLLVSKADHQLLGRTEFEIRDRVHAIGAKALHAALEGRKKGGTTAPA